MASSTMIFNDVLERMLGMFRNDPAISSRVAEFRIGELEDPSRAGITPALWVTTAPSSYRTSEGVGSSSPARSPLSQYEFQVGILVSGSVTPGDVKRDLVSLRDDVERVLNSNPRLLDRDGTDPRFTRSWITSVEEDPAHRGSLSQVMIITVHGQVSLDITATITPRSPVPPGFSPAAITMTCLSIPGISDSTAKSGHRLDDGALIRKLVGAGGGTVDIEVEAARVAEDALRPLLRSSVPCTVSISDGRDGYTGSTHICTIDALNTVAPYDEIARRVISCTILS